MHTKAGKGIVKLIRISPPNDFQRRQNNDLNIQRDAPIIYVPNIEVDPLFHRLNGRCLTATTTDLCPTGDPGLHMMAEGVVADLFGKIVIVSGGARALRRGPTSDISRLTTLNSCGSSSMLVLRNQAPLPVTRRSLRTTCLIVGPSSTSVIVRNLKILNLRRLKPHLVCLNSASPG